MPTILRPSAADIWTNCPGQPALVERLVPEQPASEAAMEGTCAAWLAEQVLTGAVDKCSDLVGEVCPENNWPVDYIMANHIQKYCDMITKRGGDIHAERKVHLNEFIEGTPDAYASVVLVGSIYYPDSRPDISIQYKTTMLCVDDLKYGFGIVQPTSKQVLIYTAAIAWGMVSEGHPPDIIRIGIYQPRGYHTDGIYRTRELTLTELTLEANAVIEAGRLCFDPDAQLKPGAHCIYCPAAHVCGASSAALYDIYAMMMGRESRHMTGAELAGELRFLDLVSDLLKGKKTAIEAEANARLDAGEFVPGWDRKHGYGNRRWTAEPKTVQAMTGIDPTDGRMVTPAAMEKKGVDPKLLKHLTETPRTKAKLVPITQEDIRKAFGK